MLMRKDGASRLVVILRQDDFEELDITFARFDYKNEQTRKIISDILKKAREEQDFDSQGKRLTIEVYPAGGGCEIVFEAVEREQPVPLEAASTLCAFRFNGSEELYACLEQVGEILEKVTLSAALYQTGSHYITVFLTDSSHTDRLHRILQEFADDLGENRQMLSRLDEYGQLLLNCRSLSRRLLVKGV